MDRPRAALVMAHGVMSHAAWLAPLSAALGARGISAVAVDRPGSGRAKQVPGACDPRAWVDGLVAAVAEARREHERVALLGWCWGARTAILAAQAIAVDHLVLAAPGLAMVAHIRARAAELRETKDDPVPLPFDVGEFSADPAVVAWIRGDALAWTSQPRAFLQPSRDVLDRALAVLPSLSVPRTTLLADRDRIVDNAAVKAIVGSSAVQELSGGHAVVLESPDAVAAPVAAILAP